jgi:hypothetical protein
MDPQVPGNLGDRLAGLPDNADRPLPKLGIEFPPSPGFRGRSRAQIGDVGCIGNQLRSAAGHDVPLAMFGAPEKLGYWRAAEDLVSWRCCPPDPCDGSLRLLDEYAVQLAKYRGEVSS